ncbi:MAG: glycosyltransferase [Clostridia bacterium]|nr:glycosyltransferase [Clostridia bacterium]
MEKKVSIIVTVKNSEQHIKRCLESLFNQTIKELEVIIIDSDSQDETEYIIKEFIEKYKENITYIKTEDLNKAMARNLGVKKVTTNFFMFIDCEDYLEPEACEEMYKEALRSNYDIVSCDGFYYHLATDYKEEVKLYNKFSDSEVRNFIVSNFRPWAKLFNTNFWRNNNLKFAENIEYEDLALIPALVCYANKIKHIDRPLYNILQNRIGTTDQELYIKSIKDIFKALVILESDFANRKKEEEYKEEIEYLYIQHLLYEATTMFLKCDNYKDDANKIVDLMKRKFPHFKWNSYYVQRKFRFRLVCRLIYRRKYKLVKKILKI